MDLMTLFWMGMMGIIGIYLGISSLKRGAISTSSQDKWGLPLYRRPSPVFYCFSIGFLTFGVGLVLLAIYFGLAY